MISVVSGSAGSSGELGIFESTRPRDLEISTGCPSAPFVSVLFVTG